MNRLIVIIGVLAIVVALLLAFLLTGDPGDEAPMVAEAPSQQAATAPAGAEQPLVLSPRALS